MNVCAGIAVAAGTAVATRADLFAALAKAGSVRLAAYVLEPGSPIERALAAAADRGARVCVLLAASDESGQARAGDGIARTNRAAAADLERHGVAVHLAGPGEPAVHLKATIVDATVFLDDRNWPSTGPDTIVATSDANDVAAVAVAFGGSPPANAAVAVDKRAALACEADAIARGSGDRIDVQSETFGFSAVSSALARRAEGGAHVRLIVSRREYEAGGLQERRALAKLAAAGVAVRLTSGNEKLCVAGDRGWVGSANATFAVAPTRDWGLETRDPALTSALEERFERTWATAALMPPAATSR